MTAPLLRIDDVACLRGGRLLFAGLNLSLASGDAVVVRGPNGVGKSSLLRMAAGLLAPAAGTVRTSVPCALMDENLALDEERPLAEALRFWAVLDGLGQDRRRVGDALHDTALAALAAVPVRLLSTGQRRRAALARVVASRAPLWLLDEPANGVDAEALTRLEALITRHRGGGGAVLIATHQPIDMPGARELPLRGAA